tara:strand:- start:5296 stop:5526 length:231 start_codon:yes stop_codon:yes gene_type:complete
MKKSSKRKNGLIKIVKPLKDYKVICVDKKLNKFWLEKTFETFSYAKDFVDSIEAPNIEYYIQYKDSNRVLYKKIGE